MKRKTERSLTRAQLDAALGAAIAEMFEGSARSTLEALFALTEGASDTAAVRLDGPPPVSVAHFDEALAEARECELPKHTLAALTKLRPLLVSAEGQAAKAGGAPVTRAEFESAQAATALALVVISDILHDATSGPLDKRLQGAAQSAEFEAVASGIKALIARIEKARSAEGVRQRRRASSRLHVVNGAGGFNY